MIVKAGSSNGHAAKRSLSPENNCDVSKKLKVDLNVEEKNVKKSKVLRKIEASSPFNYFLNKVRLIFVHLSNIFKEKNLFQFSILQDKSYFFTIDIYNFFLGKR